jgi:hypothetical protein
MVAHMPVGHTKDLLERLAALDHISIAAATQPMISQMIETTTCAGPTCNTQLPMRYTYYVGGPSSPIIQIAREQDLCLYCATKMFLAAGDLASALIS